MNYLYPNIGLGICFWGKFKLRALLCARSFTYIVMFTSHTSHKICIKSFLEIKVLRCREVKQIPHQDLKLCVPPKPVLFIPLQQLQASTPGWGSGDLRSGFSSFSTSVCALGQTLVCSSSKSHWYSHFWILPKLFYLHEIWSSRFSLGQISWRPQSSIVVC